MKNEKGIDKNNKWKIFHFSISQFSFCHKKHTSHFSIFIFHFPKFAFKKAKNAPFTFHFSHFNFQKPTCHKINERAKRKNERDKTKKTFKFQFSFFTSQKPTFLQPKKKAKHTFPFSPLNFPFKKTRLCQKTAETKQIYIRQTKPILLDNLEPNEHNNLYTWMGG